MKIEKSKETLILTRCEKAILMKASEILDEIFQSCEADGEIEPYSREAMNNIEYLLEDVEVEGGEPKEKTYIAIEI
jgi:hypothetical protein